MKTTLISVILFFGVGKVVAQTLGLPIGQQSVPFTQNDINGKPVSLDSFNGKYILLDFWASWCTPCRMENPNLALAYKQYHEKGLEVISISLDKEKDAWLEAIHADSLTWINLSDLKFWDNEVAKLYNVTALPYNFLIDQNGIIIARLLKGERLFKKLNEIFK